MDIKHSGKRMEVPLFPLGTTLYPQGLLPLKIFEVRYLDMIKRSFKERQEFGVVTLLEGPEVRHAEKSVAFGDYGTLAKITHFEAVSPALYMIMCEGQQRFQILDSRCEKNGLWMAQIELLIDDENYVVPPELQVTADLLDSLLQRLSQQDNSALFPIGFPWRLDDCGWVANRWCEMLPISAQQKLHLLALDNPRLRLDLVHDLLEEYGLLKDLPLKKK